MKNIFKRVKSNLGEETVDTALLLAILLPIFLCFALGGWAFFEAQSEANDINFDAGRYLSVNGCTYDSMRTMSSKAEFSNYMIYNNSGTAFQNGYALGEEYAKTKSSKGVISVVCAEHSTKGSDIKVSTSTKSARFGTYFPLTASRTAYFTQEISGY